MKTKKTERSLAAALLPYRGLGPSLWAMFVATMVNRFGDFVGPFLALYLSRVLGYDPVASGIFVSIAFGASALGAFLSGRVADAFGRKSGLLAAHAVVAAFNIALSLVYDRAWAPVLIVLASLFRGGVRPLISALLTDLAPPERRKEVFGLQYWSINVGVAIGPLAAAFLFDNALPWLFRGDALCTLASVALIARGVRVPAGPARTASALERRDERGALRAFLARPILLAYSVIGLASSVTYSQTGFSLPLTLSSALGPEGPRAFGYMMSLNAIAVITLGLPLASALRSRSPMWCMALSGLFYVVGFGMLAAPLGLLGFAASTLVWTVGEIVASVNFGVFMARHSPENWRGSFQSFVGASYQAGWAAGPLAAGPLLAAGGPALLWGTAAALCLVWAAGCLRVDRMDRLITAGSERGEAAA